MLVVKSENLLKHTYIVLTKSLLLFWLHYQVQCEYTLRMHCEGNFRYLLAYWYSVLNQALWKCSLIVTFEKCTCMSQILHLVLALQNDNTILRFKSHAWNVFYCEEAVAFVGELCLYRHQYLKIHSKSLKNRMVILRIGACTFATISLSQYTWKYETNMSSVRQLIMSVSPSIPLSTFKQSLRNVVYTLSYWRTPHQPIISVSHREPVAPQTCSLMN